jgi:signal transduction histidine kinase
VVIKWLVAVTDIHEQKEAENRKDIFLSMASHELKTPITTLKTLLHIYKSEVMGDNDACPTVLEQAESQLLRIERLVGNLLDASKMNADKMVCRFEEFDFGNMVQECIARMQQQPLQHSILLEQNTKILFTGDKLRLEQVMNNLLSNAIKYAPVPGTINVKSYISQNELCVSVEDFGIGIAPEQIEHIFTAYYRVNNTSAAYQGLGIGLYICSEIIKIHHGKLWVQSVPGQGSTFYFSLPISRQFTFNDL